MATLREIRRRIASITKISQVTDAMRMVATAKLRRAQQAIEANRPYADKFGRILNQLIHLNSVTEENNTESQLVHPLLEVRPVKRVCIISVSGDRGLCGSFNANTIRTTNQRLQHYQQQGIEVDLICVGRRVADFFRRRLTVSGEYVNIFNNLKFEVAIDLANKVSSMYSGKSVDSVEIIYNNFRSAILQVVQTEQLLPLDTSGQSFVSETSESISTEYLYEPTREEILHQILPKHLNAQIWKALLDSNAAEQAARMTAMENATQNAKDIIDELVLQRNRARQTLITKEVAEIVSGAEALG
ncbi:MAG: ATP synthase F1 subunit gamma [Candidatus Poribacteria bacterium]|nr:ATP synthase F1 subunit gamma [Candidatus Poribacteria bacterium]